MVANAPLPPWIAIDRTGNALCGRCPADHPKNELSGEVQVREHLDDPALRRYHGRWESPLQAETDVRAILDKIDPELQGVAYTEALVKAFSPYLESRRPFYPAKVAAQLEEVVGVVEWGDEETCGWWVFPAPEGPFAGTVVAPEWDYTGWRWGYTRRDTDDIDVIIPLSGSGLTVVADLLAILTRPLPTPARTLASVATEDGTVTTADRAAMNIFVGRAAKALAEALHTPR